MKIGKLDRRITIERATLTVNDYGERAETWTTLATVWSEVNYRPGSGGESIQSDQIYAVQPVRFVIRYSSTVSGVRPSDRVNYAGQYYQIEAVQEIGREEGLRLVTTSTGE